MIAKYLCATAVAAGLVLAPATESQADEGAAFLGGALVGGLIVNEVHKNKQRQQRAARQSTRRATGYSGTTAAQRQQNREVQSALNYFGYNVGVVDGQLGRRSRAGISRYQADMGYNIDGYLDAHERNFLLTSHQRALSSAHVAPYNQILASQGQAGLLRTYRNEQLGIATPGQPQSQLAVVPQTQQQGTAPQGTVTARADTGGQLPSFGFASTGKSPNALCNETNVATASNGGSAQPGSVTNPALALNEQFCHARVQAMAEASQLEEAIPNMTAPQIEDQCLRLTEALQPQVSGIEYTAMGEVIDKTSGFLRNSGQPMDQLVSGGKVCLGVGYRLDDADMALASGVLLAAAGQSGYGEVVSHHLREGLGVNKSTGSQPGDWMRLALGAAQSGNTVLGQTPGRIAVLSEASGGAGGGSLPVFSTSSGN